MPEWTAGQAATSENGGSSDAILVLEQEPARRGGVPPVHERRARGADLRRGRRLPRVRHAILASSSFRDVTPAYFGGQAINQVLAQAADSVLPGWSYLPFQVYANSIFPDTVGQAYTGKTSLDAGLRPGSSSRRPTARSRDSAW